MEISARNSLKGKIKQGSEALDDSFGAPLENLSQIEGQNRGSQDG